MEQRKRNREEISTTSFLKVIEEGIHFRENRAKKRRRVGQKKDKRTGIQKICEKIDEEEKQGIQKVRDETFW